MYFLFDFGCYSVQLDIFHYGQGWEEALLNGQNLLSATKFIC